MAHGAAVYAVIPEAYGVNGQIVIRRLGFDGGVQWEDRWGRGRRETPVQAAVHHNGQLVLIGDSLDGCFAARWHAEGRQSWSTTLVLGEECRARALHLDAAGQVYVLGTVSGGGIVQAALWKLDSRGDTLWRYRHDGPTPHYAYGLSLSPTADELIVTVVRNGPSGWVYDNVRLDSSGRRLYK